MQTRQQRTLLFVEWVISLQIDTEQVALHRLMQSNWRGLASSFSERVQITRRFGKFEYRFIYFQKFKRHVSNKHIKTTITHNQGLQKIVVSINLIPMWMKCFYCVLLSVKRKGGSIAKKQTFRLSDPDFWGQKSLLLTAIHCSEIPDDVNHTLQNLTRVTSVTDVITEMF